MTGKRFTILAYGSRGDVQPYVALGDSLLRRGHGVRLAAPGRFRDFVEAAGLEFAPLSGEPAELIRAASERADVRAGLLRTLRTMLEYALPLATRVLDEVNEACQGADAIIHSLLLSIPGHEAALRLDLPDFAALVFLVFTPTRAFPCAIFPEAPLPGGYYNALTHHLFSQGSWLSSRLGYGMVRRKQPDLPPLTEWPFGKPGRGRRPTPVLYGVSPQVIPRPADWPAHAHLTGYWFLNQGRDWTPPPDLQTFLEAGPPPVYIGFGSTVSQDTARLTAAALQALQATGQRGILQAGWGGLENENIPANVYALESAPFDWLFPRLAAAVHHGGVGTTAEALRAGIPSVVTPFIADQAFWGRRVRQIGAGPPPIPYYRLNATNLAGAIRQAVQDDDLRRTCAGWQERLKDEDGATRAAEVLESYLGDSSQSV